MKHGILIILCFALSCLMHTGCDSPIASDTLSTAFIRFDPQSQFAAHGFIVEQAKIPGRVGQEASFGWRPFQGSIVLPSDSSGCELVTSAVHEALVQVVGCPCHDENMRSPTRRRGDPLYEMFRYSKDGMCGLVHVWLFPNPTETRINYAILLHEEKAAIDFRSI